MNKEEIKKKHHFVSQFYLKAWSTDSSKIYALKKTTNEKPFLVKTNETALSNYFYESCLLTDMSLNFLHSFAKSTNSLDTPVYKLIITTIQDIYNLVNTTQELSNQFKKPILISDLAKENSIFQTNALENYYCVLEEKFAVIIKKIIYGESYSLTIDDYDILLFFVTSQFMRTQKRRTEAQQITEQFLPNLSHKESKTLLLYLSLLLDQKLHLALVNSLYVIHIVENKTSLNLLTSDNPVVNTKFHSSNNSEVEYIVSISPKFYLHVKENMYSKTVTNSLIESFKINSSITAINKTILLESTENINQIAWVNHLIKKESHRFMYALEANDLH